MDVVKYALVSVLCCCVTLAGAQPQTQVQTQTTLPPTSAVGGIKSVIQNTLSSLGKPVQNIIKPAIASVQAFRDDPLQTMPKELNNRAEAERAFRISNCRDTAVLPDKLDLLDAIDMTLCNNPKTKQSWAAMKERTAEIGQRRGTFLPTLSASGTAERTVTFTNEDTLPTSDNVSVSRSLTGTLSWRVFDFGTRASNLEASRYLLTSAFFEHDSTIQSTLATVIQAYFQAQSSRSRWQTFVRTEGIYLQILEATRRRERAGVGSANDSLRAEVNLRRAQVEMATAWNDYQTNLASLLFAMGAQSHLRDDLDLVENLETGVQDGALGELKQWFDLVSTQHPILQSFRAALASAQEQLKAQRANSKPTLDLSLNASRSLPMQQSLFGGGRTTTSAATATLTVPLFQGFIPHYQAKAIEAQIEATKARMEETLQTVQRDLSLSYLGARSAYQKLNATSKLVDVNQRTASSSQRRFDAGLVPISEVLNAQNDLVSAELTRIQNVFDWKQTRLSLLAAAAVLDKTDYLPGSALVDNLKPKWSLDNSRAATTVQTSLNPQQTTTPGLWQNTEDFLPAPPRRNNAPAAPLAPLNTLPKGLPIGVIRTIPAN